MPILFVPLQSNENNVTYRTISTYVPRETLKT